MAHELKNWNTSKLAVLRNIKAASMDIKLKWIHLNCTEHPKF